VLVLSRRLNESIVLPDLGITVRVVAVRGGQVRIGVEAPHHVRVFREEVLSRELAADDPPAVRRGAG
jgi:carbon storage regulator